MRNVAQLPDGIPKQVDENFPWGTVYDNAVGQVGTPVTRLIYGDILTNLYKLLAITGIVANGEEDNEETQYQLVQALQLLTNVLNDVEQPLVLNGNIFSLPVNLDLLPDKYLMHAQVSGAYVTGTEYTIEGTGDASYTFTAPEGFNDGDELLLVLDQNGVRAYSLTSASGGGASGINYSVFGSPVAYNDSAKVWYQSQGILFSDLPEAYDLQSAIQVASGSGTIIVYEMIIMNGYVLCLTFDTDAIAYAFYQFDITNLGNPPSVVTGAGTSGTDNQPFVYAASPNLIYITNNGGVSANDPFLRKFTFNPAASNLAEAALVRLDPSFEKTTNAVISAGYLYTFIRGVIAQFSLASGAVAAGPTLPGYLGILFVLNGNVYYANDSVAKQWTLPVYEAGGGGAPPHGEI